MNDDSNDYPKLEQALRRLAKDRIFVPPAKDEEMLGAIRKHFDSVAPEMNVMFGTTEKAALGHPNAWYKWLALAASLTIAGLFLYFSAPKKHQLADLNRDGVIDVIDALTLAEQLRDGKGVDINGDHTVDERDAAEIAVRAVDLERRGS